MVTCVQYTLQNSNLIILKANTSDTDAALSVILAARLLIKFGVVLSLRADQLSTRVAFLIHLVKVVKYHLYQVIVNLHRSQMRVDARSRNHAVILLAKFRYPKRKRKLVALPSLSYKCIVTIHVLWLFLTVPWVGLQCLIVVFPGHTHLPFHVLSSFAIILTMKKELIALLVLSFGCLVTVIVLWLSFTVPWVGLYSLTFLNLSCARYFLNQSFMGA